MGLPQRKSNRLPGRDYAREGWYFVTLCCHGRGQWFGQIHDGEVVLNDIGRIVHDRLQWLAQQYTYVQLGPYVIMPNHLHALIGIQGPVGDGRDRPAAASTGGSRPAPTRRKSLSGLIGAMKTTSSRDIHKLGHHDFRWQRSFHDNIVRNAASWQRIRDYIEDNPRNWGTDAENPTIQQEEGSA